MKIGDVINLTGQWRHEEEPFNYRCKIVDMGQNTLYIDYPVDVNTSRTVHLPLDEPFYVRYIKESAVFQFQSKVIERTNRIIPVLKIVVPNKEEFQKIQRRAHLRVDTAVDIAIHCPEESFSPFTTVTKDLSGGGARFVIPPLLENINLEQAQTISCYLVLRFSSEKYEYIETEAEIIRVLHDKTPIEVSISFLNEDRNIEQTIIQYCFQIEREIRRQNL